LGFKTRALLIAAAMVCAAAPALGYADQGGSFTAVDYAWQANGTAETTVTVTPGQTVAFGYPAGTTTHNVDFTGKQPTQCTGLTPYPRPKGWTASCTFDAPGTYTFVCDVHPQMQGTVVVASPAPAAPTATPTPEPGADPVATPGPTVTTPAGTAPEPTPAPGTKPATTLKLKLATRQKGTRLRGTVTVEQPASRLEVTVKSGKTKVGTWLRRSTGKGTVTFSVPLNAKARQALAAKHRLKLAVTVALTPPGGRLLTKHAITVVSL
jgi:plastocyanin